jgi:hypothetical protein
MEKMTALCRHFAQCGMLNGSVSATIETRIDGDDSEHLTLELSSVPGDLASESADSDLDSTDG